MTPALAAVPPAVAAGVHASMRAAAASVTLPAAVEAGLLPPGTTALVRAAEAARGALGAHARGGYGRDPGRDAALDAAIALAEEAVLAAERRYAGHGAMPPLVRAQFDELWRLHDQLRRRRAGAPPSDAPTRGPVFSTPA